MIGVVTHLGRQVKSTRKAGLSFLEEKVKPLIRRLCGTKASVLPHRPWPRAIHRGIDATREREVTRIPQGRLSAPSREVSPRVQLVSYPTRILRLARLVHLTTLPTPPGLGWFNLRPYSKADHDHSDTNPTYCAASTAWGIQSSSYSEMTISLGSSEQAGHFGSRRIV